MTSLLVQGVPEPQCRRDTAQRRPCHVPLTPPPGSCPAGSDAGGCSHTGSTRGHVRPAGRQNTERGCVAIGGQGTVCIPSPVQHQISTVCTDLYCHDTKMVHTCPVCVTSPPSLLRAPPAVSHSSRPAWRKRDARTISPRCRWTHHPYLFPVAVAMTFSSLQVNAPHPSNP